MRLIGLILSFLLAGCASMRHDSSRHASTDLIYDDHGWPLGCSWYCGAPPIAVTASNTLRDGINSYEPANIHDHDKSTVWASSGSSIGTRFGIAETWLTWEDGLEHLVKRKGQLVEIDLGNSIIDPADLERLRRELPAAKIIWGGPTAAAEELKKPWLRGRAEQWIPKELIEKALSGQ